MSKIPDVPAAAVMTGGRPAARGCCKRIKRIRDMKEKAESMETTIDLREVVSVLWRRAFLIVAAAILGALIAFAYTYFLVVPQYKSSTLMYVNNSDLSLGSTSFKISNADLTAAQNLVDTYVVILKSRTVLNEVIRVGELDCSYESLRDMISAASVNSTEVFEIVVTSSSPTEAEHIANTIAEVLPGAISNIVNGADVRIVDYAVVPAHRSSPSYTKNVAVGFLLGLVLCAAVIIVLYLLDENIYSEDYLTQNYGDIPLLSVVPDMGESQRGGYYGYGGSYGHSYGYAASAAKHRSGTGGERSASASD